MINPGSILGRQKCTISPESNNVVSIYSSTSLYSNTSNGVVQNYDFVGWHLYRIDINKWYCINGTSKMWCNLNSIPSGYHLYVLPKASNVIHNTVPLGERLVLSAVWSNK